MIQNKQDLAFYIVADRIMNGYPAKCSLLSKIKETKVIGGGKTIIMITSPILGVMLIIIMRIRELFHGIL